MHVSVSRLSILAFAAASLTACVSQQQVDPTNARAAVYATDYNTLFREVAVAVKTQYPNLAARPEERAVKTAWHPLPLSETVETAKDRQRVGQADEHWDERRNRRRAATRREMKHFVRFDISIQSTGAPGSQNWRIVVTGQASQHDGTGIPAELNGAERPYWLETRIAKLEVAIHNRVLGIPVASR